jgi:hypothetical protein
MIDEIGFTALKCNMLFHKESILPIGWTYSSVLPWRLKVIRSYRKKGERHMKWKKVAESERTFNLVLYLYLNDLNIVRTICTSFNVVL